MGGDGGVIASNRKYMRGAGKAEHTGDEARHSDKLDPAVINEELHRVLTTCAVSNQPLALDGRESIVVCPYGRLYRKEAAIEALLRRKQQQISQDDNRHDGILGSHIRGLKDLHEIRFHLVKSSSSNTMVPACPITGTELNGTVAALALIPGKPSSPNVISERGLKEMGSQTVQEEYGPFDDKIRIAPPPKMLQEIQKACEQKREEKLTKKKSRNEEKKRKHGNEQKPPGDDGAKKSKK